MLRWNDQARERAIDLACVPDLTVDQVAGRMSCSRKSMFDFYRNNRAEIVAAKESVQISDKDFCAILDMVDDGWTHEDVAEHLSLTTAVVRRILLISEIDEENSDTGAASSLAALQAAFPGKFYEEDPRAEREYAGAPVFLLAADCVAPFSQERCAA